MIIAYKKHGLVTSESLPFGLVENHVPETMMKSLKLAWVDEILGQTIFAKRYF